ncbi:UNVERIFIED_CONTAM: MFS transporter, partial [Bifidobacterium breve]|nr:MFS transporter [Bifidobacterium breve]
AGLVFACVSIRWVIGDLVYSAKNWWIALWKHCYFCLAVVNIGISTFLLAKHLWVIMIICQIIGGCQAPTWISGSQLMLHLVPPSRLTGGMAWMGAMTSIGSSAGSAIAGQFSYRMGSYGGLIVVTPLALASRVIALLGFRQTTASSGQPPLTGVS